VGVEVGLRVAILLGSHLKSESVLNKKFGSNIDWYATR
jgi:hypothetical protein